MSAGTRARVRELTPQAATRRLGAVVPCTVLVGSPRQRSRTQTVTELLARRTCDQLREAGVDVEPARLIELRKLSPIAFDGQQEEVQAAIADVMRPGLLFIGSPTYLETFSGMLKVLLDLVPRDGLGQTVAVPVMTAADRRHRFAVERYLAPLLVAMGATVPVPGLSVIEEEMPRIDGLLDSWCEGSCAQLVAALEEI
ncbi:MAG TPA: NAD(P)H-dependent oxidoreductase [Kribbella sp.]